MEEEVFYENMFVTPTDIPGANHGEETAVATPPAEPTETKTEPVKQETTSPEEVKTEVTTEETKITPSEETPPVEETTPPAEPEKPEYLKKFSELSDGELNFASDDEIKDFIKKHKSLSSKAEELEKHTLQVQAMKEIVKKYTEENDIVKKLGGEKNYKNSIIALELSKGRGKLDDVLPLASRIVNNIDTMSDFDALVNLQKLDAPNLSDARAKRATLIDLGIDTSEIENWDNPMDNLSEDDQAVIELHAAKAKRKLHEAINAVEIPEQPDVIKQLEEYETEKNNKVVELKGKWGEVRTPLVDSLAKLEYKEYGYEFEIPLAEREQIVDQFINEAANLGKEPDEATKQMVIQRMKQFYKKDNADKMIAAIVSHVKTSTTKEVKADQRNLTPLRVDETPPPDVKRLGVGDFSL